MFGQWTWTGNGIEPLFKDKSKTHKILKFPILEPLLNLISIT